MEKGNLVVVVVVVVVLIDLVSFAARPMSIIVCIRRLQTVQYRCQIVANNKLSISRCGFLESRL